MIGNAAASPSSLPQQFAAWAERVGLARRLALALTLAAIVSGIATYGAISGQAPFGPDPHMVVILLNIDLVLLLVLAALIARHMVGVWVQRRRGLAGARLHIRLVVLFSAVAVTPAIIVAVFSALFLNFGIQSWFSERVSTALDESLQVAQAYLREHQQTVRADALAMANDLNRQAFALAENPVLLNRVVSAQAAVRSLTEAVVFDDTGRLWARAGLSFSLEFEPLPERALATAREGDVALLTSENDDRVRALVQLDRYIGLFLFVGRYVEPRVVGHMTRTQDAVNAYKRLEVERSRLQILFSLLFVVVALLLLLAAIWVGLDMATRLARPISGLIAAAEKVRAGDLGARVPEGATGDELESLSRAFNRMTSQIEGQRAELVEANRQLDIRRHFTEAVLAGVSAGVIGLDVQGRINLPNRSAATLLSIDLDAVIGQALADVVPEMAELVDKAAKRPERLAQSQIVVERDRRQRTLLVRIAADIEAEGLRGYVVTFDDVTELMSAQRKAAWADVARRIAHEIKNPLTPIQLSAERLKRRYAKEIVSDPETFIACTDTIVRQVADIGRMVDEFSAFARMPAPVMRPENLNELCRESLFLQRQAHSEVSFSNDLPKSPVLLRCDARQIRQSVTNLLQNALDAIEGRPAPADGGALPPGAVALRLAVEEGQVVIEVGDNGRGFPTDESRERLTEPYVTTRTKGTGLGLAIVKKIMEDHGGDVVLEDRVGGGACVRLVFGPAEAENDTGIARHEREGAINANKLTMAHGS
ncbi:MAG: PAS domain-containing sensor histidine kinase [Alphaproteobacteria bacterium]|nr:PAS domain-containing sensor histidine kinase [Alphaproteobacteria bacterium]